MNRRVVALLALLFCSSISAQIRTEQVHFAAGSSATTLRGRIQGPEIVDYQLRARGRQAMTLTFAPSNPSAYFNLLPPGSDDAAIFIGSRDGNAFDGRLPADGEYKVRVSLMRSAARRNEVSDYTLEIATKGAGNKPQSAATIGGTEGRARLPGSRRDSHGRERNRPAFSAVRQRRQTHRQDAATRLQARAGRSGLAARAR